MLTRFFAQSQSVTFVDITAQAGLTGALNPSGSPRDKQFLLEEMGGGVALLDFDNDTWLDVFLVNGSSFSTGGHARKPTSYLFRDNRNMTFTDVSDKAGRYGICRECPEPIAKSRLKVMPFATRCVACQAQLEGLGRAA